MLEMEIGSTRSQSVENSLWKRLWTCHKTDYMINGQSINHINLRCSCFFYRGKCLPRQSCSVESKCIEMHLSCFLTFCCHFYSGFVKVKHFCYEY